VVVVVAVVVVVPIADRGESVPFEPQDLQSRVLF
jgi:hypothetical protein